MNHTTGTNPVFSGANKLKLGIFCTNSRTALTLVPELYTPKWDTCVAAAQAADRIGIEAIVPIARWKGYVDGDFGHPTHEVIDPFIYAAGIAQQTKHAAVFATTHAPTLHPLVVAKQSASIDVLSNGRFTLNVVGGWNRREFEMFGIDLLEHDKRYDYLRAWITAIRKLWTADDEFDLDNAYFHMKNALSRPQPVQKPHVPIMNAALSPAGMRFAAEHADIGLISLLGPHPEGWAKQVESYKRLAREEFGREIQIWSNTAITVRDTDAEAEAYFSHYTETMVDEPAISGFLSTVIRENNISPDSDQYKYVRRYTIGMGSPLIGSPDTVGKQLKVFSDVGIDGVLMTFVDVAGELARFDRDVMPLMEQAGLRKGFAHI